MKFFHTCWSEINERGWAALSVAIVLIDIGIRHTGASQISEMLSFAGDLVYIPFHILFDMGGWVVLPVAMLGRGSKQRIASWGKVFCILISIHASIIFILSGGKDVNDWLSTIAAHFFIYASSAILLAMIWVAFVFVTKS